ncbi:MAG TPA: metalloregulator ArsR/SmtB family transcription factor [Spirochaetota bacterium]|nr:metalloregulator ArsR/SmtB family transcription factor [Spirochaetota bacterium]HPF07363.1 metalloregulator ArsR/SmtB family transcription factor [Spirochaetota bacterium]HPJ43662.1 metalloregulator ArsR/SmtB family transcription factor [Spirochaetota bacterium]HRX48527.1 metalloregulator ArsR/SmtB family transcription factor [Spirochaetota bacterium]
MTKQTDEIYSEHDTRLSEYAKALSHPARIAILKHLAEQDRCICGELVDILPLAQSTVSQHLKELKKAGLITGEIEGPRSCYCINKEKYMEMIELISSLSSIITKIKSDNKKGCC